LPAIWSCDHGKVYQNAEKGSQRVFQRRVHVERGGFTSSMPRTGRAELTRKLERLIEPPGFTGNAPGGPSRWSTKRSTQWQPLQPKLVVEVQYDHFTGGRFRHGTRLVRWRPDKAPRQCRMEQVSQAGAASLKLLRAASKSA
jgi:ATP-dependent DNA ligase